MGSTHRRKHRYGWDLHLVLGQQDWEQLVRLAAKHRTNYSTVVRQLLSGTIRVEPTPPGPP